jgi:nitrite reductase/ring-hydroxylating ferredoxin subunit
MNWIRIFTTVDEAKQRIMPNKPQLVVIGNMKICLVRIGENFKAVQDACSHNGESLSKGHVNYLGEIICPWHNYCFSMDNGREVQGRSADLTTFPIKADADGFFIGVD